MSAPWLSTPSRLTTTPEPSAVMVPDAALVKISAAELPRARVSLAPVEVIEPWLVKVGAKMSPLLELTVWVMLPWLMKTAPAAEDSIDKSPVAEEPEPTVKVLLPPMVMVELLEKVAVAPLKVLAPAKVTA